MNLSKVRLIGANLAGANLTGVTLSGTDLTGADLSNADLTGALWKDAADLSGANVAGAKLATDAANITAPYLISLSSPLKGAAKSLFSTTYKVAGGWVFGPKVVLNNANLTGLNITGFDITGMRFLGNVVLKNLVSGAITTQAEDLPAGAAIISGRLVGPGVNLASATLSGSLNGVNLTGANIAGADLSAVDPTGATTASLSGVPAKLPTGWKLVKGALVKS